MENPNKNAPRRSSRKKKQTRETESDKRDIEFIAKSRKVSNKKTSSRRTKRSELSSPIGTLHKRVKKLPSLAELEKMFDDSSSEDDTTANVTINKNCKQFSLNEGSQTPTILPKQTLQNCDQIEIVNNGNNAIFPPINSNQNTYDEIDLTSLNDTASYLKQLEDEFSDDSSSSTKTITYDYNIQQNKPNTFSPLPSTSRDNETIMQNEILFNESMTIDSSQCNDRETMVRRINNRNITRTSSQHNAEENPLETIVIDDVQPCRRMIKDDNVVIDVENYKMSTNNSLNDENIMIDRVNLTQSPITVNTTKFIDQNPLQTLIYIRPKELCASNSSVPISTISKINITSARTNQNTNITFGNNILNTLNCNTTADSEAEDSSSDNSSNAIKSELHTLKNQIHIYRKASGADSVGHYKYITCPKMNLKIMTWDMKKQDRNKLKDGLRVKKHKDDSMRRNDGVMQNLQNTSEDHRNQPRVESNGNQEIETMTHRNSHDPISLGSCPICIEPLKKDIASTICGHLFCLRCIRSSLQITGKKCPTCRKSLKGAGYHQIFI